MISGLKHFRISMLEGMGFATFATEFVQPRRKAMVRLKKILFPTDFSTNSNSALAHAARLTDFQDGELIVQHVVSNYFDRHPHWTTIFDVHEMQKYMNFFIEEEMAKALSSFTNQISIR